MCLKLIYFWESKLLCFIIICQAFLIHPFLRNNSFDRNIYFLTWEQRRTLDSTVYAIDCCINWNKSGVCRIAENIFNKERESDLTKYKIEYNYIWLHSTFHVVVLIFLFLSLSLFLAFSQIRKYFEKISLFG